MVRKRKLCHFAVLLEPSLASYQNVNFSMTTREIADSRFPDDFFVSGNRKELAPHQRNQLFSCVSSLRTGDHLSHAQYQLTGRFLLLVDLIETLEVDE